MTPLVAFRKEKGHEISVSLSREATAAKQPSAKKGVRQTLRLPASDLGLAASRTLGNKWLLLQPPDYGIL